MKPRATVVSLLLAALLLAAKPAGAAPTITELFGFPAADGQDPDYLIQASDGSLYGTTYLGGGTVFKVTPSGQFTLLLTAPYNPNGTNHYPDGRNYASVAEGSDGFLYVVASSGGVPLGGVASNAGTLIKISKSGTSFEVAHAFCSAPGCTDGSGPTSLVPALDGNMYGTTAGGGSCSQCGVIFRLSPDGTYTIMHSIRSGESSPSALTPATDGNFYAICTSPGGGPPSVCRVTTSGQVTRIFQFPHGLWPANSHLTQGSDGLLYGSALVNPGSNTVQSIFQLDTSGSSFEQLFQTPIQCCVKIGYSRVIQASDGNLWITNPNSQPYGTVYSITPTGTLRQTFAFSGTNGAAPHYLIQASSGVLYGATYNRGVTAQGNGAYGTIFSINAGLPPL
jgi:uncharacterized repeat protein (TIGR03803 family)